MKKICLTVLLAFACGCSAPKKEPNVNLAGYPPEFRAGYLDGCDSVRRNAMKKDEKRFKSDPQYGAGWRDGYDICKTQQKQ